MLSSPDDPLALQTLVTSAWRETLLPDVEQFLSEPSGQNLTHFIQQFRELDVTVSVVVPQKHLRLTERQTVNFHYFFLK